MTTTIPPVGVGKEPGRAEPGAKPNPDAHGPFGRVVTTPGNAATRAPSEWVTWLLFMVPLCIAELREVSEPDVERLAARAVDLIASHGDDAQYGGHHQRSARTAIAQGLAVLARADGGVTALGIHACVRPHLGCPGDSPSHPTLPTRNDHNV
ncbi:hypothetical protein [Streptomyces lavenduligriseus]|uniref:Uncharacterized protein n=1 Tax=Streptomyces lavenduligriseus TaxID=67315 RepID=A0ABT0P5P9_9ACTN|nr:hypothetical protein [Streptomyces lavenduligriseus]MCL3998920.1 hypothetical protein [Streptomyces lavenduligriseus]